MLIRRSDAQPFEIPGGTRGILHQSLGKTDASVALVEIDGIYPERGWSINSECTETMLLIRGSLRVEIQEQQFTMKPGDMLSIAPGNRYRVVGKGESVDIITPAWQKSQNRIVEE